MNKKTIILASDHAAIEERKKLADFFKERGVPVVSFGPKEPTSVDYPDVAKEACDYYLAHRDTCEFGILLCGTGIGMSMAANSFKGIRCAVVHDVFTATYAKKHNHANFIALGSRVKLSDDFIKIVTAFNDAEVELGRHEKRVAKIEMLKGK